MFRLLIALALVGLAAPLGAQATGQGSAPPGWQMRTDPNRRAAPMTLAREGDAYRIDTGSGSGVFWNPQHTLTGPGEIRATFTQTNAQPGHAEAYGLVFNGANLETENQSYLYFVIRGSGEYMVRHRAGADVHTIADWTPHAAINKLDASGSATNTLTVRIGADSVRFLANGTQVVAYGRRNMAQTDGQVGLRANHRTQLRVSGFEIVPATR